MYSVVFLLPRLYLHTFFFTFNRVFLPFTSKHRLSSLDIANIKGIWLVEKLEELARAIVKLESSNELRCSITKSMARVVLGLFIGITVVSRHVERQ